MNHLVEQPFVPTVGTLAVFWVFFDVVLSDVGFRPWCLYSGPLLIGT
jgi:hypothetical protein